MVLPLAYADREIASQVREVLLASADSEVPEQPPHDWPDSAEAWEAHRRAMVEGAERDRAVLAELDRLHPSQDDEA